MALLAASLTRRSSIVVAAAAGLALACWMAPAARAEDAPRADTAGPAAAADAAPADMITIEYVPPKDPKYQTAYKLVQQRGALEMMKKVFAPLKLPIPVTIRTIGCDGVSNAWYQRENDRPTLSICYEYLVEIWNVMPKDSAAAMVTASDAVIGQLFFALAHEFGHAVFDIFDIPVFGREEDAADQFATYIMLQFGEDRAHRLITGAAFSYREFIKNHKQKPNVSVPLLTFSSDHGPPEQRFYNLLCLAYGYDAKVFEKVANEYLPKSRARNCRYEYVILRYAFKQLVVPHLNMDLAKVVMDTKWLDDTERRPVALRGAEAMRGRAK
jgi:putative metallopeptidase DUF4344